MTQTALDIRGLLNHLEMRTIANYNGFYFEKARAAFNAFLKLDVPDLREACELVLGKLEDFRGNEHKLEDFFVTHSTIIHLLKLIKKLVAYIDKRQANNLNDYEDGRTLDQTNIRYGIWLKHLIKYKQFGHQLSAVSALSIRYALAYLENPIKNINIFSDKKRQLIAHNLLKHTYNPDTFVEELKQFFDSPPLALNIEENRTLLFAKILTTPEVKMVWQDQKVESIQETQHPRSIIEHIHAYVRGKGFFYSKQEIANFYLSLKTKPFTILAGISGTGKTQLVRLFAEAIGAEKRCLLIPVKPDWTDSSDLIGFVDLQGNFRPKPLLKLILKAHENPKESFFVILDEMNLARVEHYFSDFLSVIETRVRIGKRIITQAIITQEELGSNFKLPSHLNDLYIPDNLFIIGTVNMDETTHPFSRKVLDRANSIEMNEVYLDWMVKTDEIEPLEGVSNDFLISPYLHAIDLTEEDKEKLKAYMVMLMHMNRILQKADLHFGYRIRDEIAFFMLNRYEIREAISENEAMDYQIMQKILPRIHGSSRRIGTLIVELIRFLARNPKINADMYADDILKNLTQSQMRFYPKSIKKLLFMYRRLEEDGFTSFWI